MRVRRAKLRLSAGSLVSIWQLYAISSKFIIWFVNLMKIERSPWFEAIGQLHEESLQLFCFPYAGGSAHVYRTWQRHLPRQVGMSLVHLPGRAKRISETPFNHWQPLVEALAEAIIPAHTEAYAFWGHSMGALISFELARELRRRGRTQPRALLVSGSKAPQVRESDPPIFNLPEPEFLAELRRLNGTPTEMLRDPETVKLFMPTTRADFQVVDTYLYQPEDPLACPIYAYGGLQDPYVPAESLSAWRAQTSSKFKARMFPGDHFFIHSSTEGLINALRRDLQEELSLLNTKTC
jgi:medium-chain acyl-[acyl-carrier-protein] hydrolase